MTMPWKSFRPAQPGGEYLALLTFLPLKSFWKIPAFFLATFRIQRQLAKSPGLVGYSLDAQPLRREFWTLSVWENENSLGAFTGASPHGGIMSDLLPHMGATRFIRWRIRGGEVPPKWTDAKKRAAGAIAA